jgi:cytochrome c biogenesis protein
MPKSAQSTPFSQAVAFFASVRLSVTLLLVLAATSILGTLIPQDLAAEAYIHQYGQGWFRLLRFLGLTDMYRSWWFQLILLLLAVNLLVCSLKRFPGTWYYVRHKPKGFEPGRFRSLKQHCEFTASKPAGQIMDAYAALVSRRFPKPILAQTDKGFTLFAEKGRASRLGPYVVHLGFLGILFGGLIGSVWGFKTHANLPEGETLSVVRVEGEEGHRPLGFALRCDDFNITYYDQEKGRKGRNLRPKEYRSTLTVLEDGTPLFTKDILVNTPLRHRGVNIFQSSYGKTDPREVELSLENQKTGMTYPLTVPMGKTTPFPEGAGEFALEEYRDGFHIRGMDIGPVFILWTRPQGGEEDRSILPVNMPGFDKRRGGAFAINVVSYKQGEYTGLQITHDPGVGIVYTGFIFLILGCVATFYTSHKQVCLEAVEDGGGTRIVVAGRASKNKIGFARELDSLAKLLSEKGNGNSTPVCTGLTLE